jgi:AraC-like DNA-binding protein
VNTPNLYHQGHKDYGVPISTIKPLAKLLVSKGASLEALLQGTDIELADFTQFGRCIPFSQYLAFIVNARRLSTRPDYALLLGEQFFINYDGVLSCRVMSSDHTLAAMELLNQYQSLFTQLLDLNLDLSPEYGVFSVVEKSRLGLALPHFVEYSFAALYSLGKFCLGGEAIELEVELSSDNPGNSHEFENFFSNPVRFNCSADRIIIPRSTLTKDIIFANNETSLVNEKLCQQQLNRVHHDQRVIQQVKQSIRSMDFTEVSLEALAEQLCMSTRTLRRHLQGQGMSYKTLLANERKRIAVQHIEQRDITIDQLADLLGYGNASSFSRAFKGWYGISPQHYKSSNSSPEK